MKGGLKFEGMYSLMYYDSSGKMVSICNVIDSFVSLLGVVIFLYLMSTRSYYSFFGR